MEKYKNREEIIEEFRKIGLTCEQIYSFNLTNQESEFEMTLSIDAPKFIESSDKEYTEKEKKNFEVYRNYNIGGLVLDFKDEEIPDVEKKLKIVVIYDSEERYVLTSYIMGSPYYMKNDEYDSEWISFLEENGYANELELKKMVDIFSREEGEKVVRRAMNKMQAEMNSIKEWIEEELERNLKKLFLT